jgi:hypothetical protein
VSSTAAPSSSAAQPGGKPQPSDSTVAHPGKVYHYWLGGKDNCAADRGAGGRVINALQGKTAYVSADLART